MCDSVPSASYSSVCNVLRQWNISLIPTYRVYRLYDTAYTARTGAHEKMASSPYIYVGNVVKMAQECTPEVASRSIIE